MPDSDNMFDPRKIRELRNVKINMGGLKITNLGDATADTDALNRQSGDARYATPDTTTPNAPGAWAAADAGTYIDARGRERGRVTLTWTDPTTNTDASAITDLEEIDIEFKRTAATAYQHFTVRPGIQTAEVDNLRVGLEYQFIGYASDTHGHTSTATATIAVTPGADATAPGQPSIPTVAGAGQRGIAVSHDLLLAAGGNLPADLHHLAVFFDTDSTVGIVIANFAGRIRATFTEITAGSGVSQTFHKMGTTPFVRGTSYWCAVVPVDVAGNKGTASAASAECAAGADTVLTAPAVPPTPTVTASRHGVRTKWDFSTGTPDYGPANLDVTAIKVFAGTSSTPTDHVGWLHVRREQLANSDLVHKEFAVAHGTTGTLYVRGRARNSLGTLSTYGLQGSVALSRAGVKDIGGGAVGTTHIGTAQVTGPKLGSGKATALITLTSAGLIQTATGGQRVVISAASGDRISFDPGNGSTALGRIGFLTTTNADFYIVGPDYTGAGAGGIPGFRWYSTETGLIDNGLEIGTITPSGGSVKRAFFWPYDVSGTPSMGLKATAGNALTLCKTTSTGDGIKFSSTAKRVSFVTNSVLRFTATTGSNSVWAWVGGVLKNVQQGALNSGGTGYRMLIVGNTA